MKAEYLRMKFLRLCLSDAIVILSVLITISKVQSVVVFYQSPYFAKIAENYTFNFSFSVQSTADVDVRTLRPICGFTQGNAFANCGEKDAATLFSTSKLGSSGYSFLIIQPTPRAIDDAVDRLTYDLAMTLLPPTPVVVATTPVMSVFLQTTPPPFPPTSPLPARMTTPAAMPLSKFPDATVSVQIFCCVPSDVGNHLNQTKLLLQPVPLVPTSWSSENDKVTFRRYPSPAHVERSACTCDLVPYSCDNLCCCDETCSVLEKESFGCSGNIVKNLLDQPSEIPNPPFRCGDLMTGNTLLYPTVSVFSPFPHAWLCLMYKNTAYLGLHYNDLDYESIASRKYVEKNKKAVQEKTFYNLQNFTSKGYKQGLPLFAMPSVPATPGPTPTPSPARSAQFTMRPALFFPGRGPDGRCLRNAPVRFLSEDDAIYCSIILRTPEQCRSSTPLSQLNFIPPSNVIISQSNAQGIQTLQRIGCKCSLDGGSSKQNAGSCLFRNDTFCYPKVRPPSNPPSPCSCKESDMTVPAVVTSGNNSWYCTNTVKAVDYYFGWNGSAIDAASSSIAITLAEGSFPGDSVEQKFTVKFVKQAASSGPSPTPSLNNPASKWRWYRFGDPVKSLPESQMTSDSSCQCLSPLPINFGISRFATCSFDLSESVFADCDNLRGMTIAALQKMIPAQLIAKVSNPTYPGSLQPNANQFSDWISVFRLRRFPPAYPDCDNVAKRNNEQPFGGADTTRLGRYPVQYQLLDERSRQAYASADGMSSNYSKAAFCGPQISRLKISQTTNLNITNRTTVFSWSPLCGTKRICERIPYAIQLTIFRSISGARDGLLQHEIIGASISFAVQDWLLDSTDKKKQSQLSANVKFIYVPVEPVKLSFVDRLLSMTTAWDILYPVKTPVEGDLSRSVAAAAGIGLLLAAGLVLAPPR